MEVNYFGGISQNRIDHCVSRNYEILIKGYTNMQIIHSAPSHVLKLTPMLPFADSLGKDHDELQN